MSPRNPFEMRPKATEKEERMAQAGESARVKAEEQRVEAAGVRTYLADPEAVAGLGKRELTERLENAEHATENFDSLAEQKETDAGIEFDARKEIEGMSDEELRAAYDELHDRKVAASHAFIDTRNALQQAGTVALPENAKRLEEMETESNRLGIYDNVWGNEIVQRDARKNESGG